MFMGEPQYTKENCCVLMTISKAKKINTGSHFDLEDYHIVRSGFYREDANSMSLLHDSKHLSNYTVQ
jgi:hypothetical protein